MGEQRESFLGLSLTWNTQERRTHMARGNAKVATKSDAYLMIETMSDVDFNALRDFLNSTS